MIAGLAIYTTRDWYRVWSGRLQAAHRHWCSTRRIWWLWVIGGSASVGGLCLAVWRYVAP